MTMSIGKLDDEIRAVEARIASERAALEQAVAGCTESLRDTVTSPKTLLALAGLGFGVGKLMFSHGKAAPYAAPAKKAGWIGLITGLAGTALSLMRSRYGVATLARWATSRAFARREPKAASAERKRSRTSADVT